MAAKDETLTFNESQDRIWLSSPDMSGAEWKYLEAAFEKNHVFPLGPNVTGLENDISKYTGAGFVTCLSSGTAAIHLALIILGIKPGDEVICPSFTFAATANPIAYLKANPVFVDSDKETWNMDPALLRQAIIDRMKKVGKKPAAIILVDLYGMPARLDALLEIAKEFDIAVVEDAAEALGSTFKNRACGTWGDIGVFSFNGNKIITTSGGGALVSDQPWHCERALFLATQARDAAPHYQHSEIGYNYRMSNISAGIGRGQMEVLDQRIAQRRAHFQHYSNALSGHSCIHFLQAPTEEFFSNHWLTVLTLDPNSGKTNAGLRTSLQTRNIESRPVWKPMHLQPVFRDASAYLNGTAEAIFNAGICLPSSSNLTTEQRQMVVDVVEAYLKK